MPSRFAKTDREYSNEITGAAREIWEIWECHGLTRHAPGHGNEEVEECDGMIFCPEGIQPIQEDIECPRCKSLGVMRLRASGPAEELQLPAKVTERWIRVE